MNKCRAVVLSTLLAMLSVPLWAQDYEGAFISGTGALVTDFSGDELGLFNIEGGVDLLLNGSFGFETQAGVTTDDGFSDFVFDGAIVPYFKLNETNKLGASANLLVSDDGDTEDFYGLHWLYNGTEGGYRGELGGNYASIAGEDVYSLVYTGEKPIGQGYSALGRASYLFIDDGNFDVFSIGPGLSYEFSTGADVFSYAEYVNVDGTDALQLTLGLRLHLKNGRHLFRDSVGISFLN